MELGDGQGLSHAGQAFYHQATLQYKPFKNFLLSQMIPFGITQNETSAWFSK